MNRTVLALLLLLFSASVLVAQPSQLQDSLNVATTTCVASSSCLVMQLPNNSAGLTIQLTQTFSATAAFEATTNGVNYSAISGTPIGGGTAVTSSTATGQWQFSVTGLSAVRVRLSVYASGAVGVIMRASDGSPSSSVSGTIGATVAIDQSTPGTTNAVACVSGCSGGTSDTDDGTVAAAQATAIQIPLNYFYNGTNWVRMLGNATDGLLVNLGANNDVTVTSGTITAVTAITNALPAGTNAIGKLAANTGVIIGDVNVVSDIPGTGATASGKAEDAAHTSGDTGNFILGVRNDSLGTTFTNNNGDYSPLSVSSTGVLRVDPSGTTTQPVSGTVTANNSTATNLKTAVSDGSGNALTSATRGAQQALSVQLVDASGNQIVTFGGAGGTSSTIGAAYPAAATAAGASDGTNMVALNVDGSGNLKVNLEAASGGGLATEASLAKLTLAQASTTSGQTGPLAQAAVTTSAPSYTNGQTSPITMTTGGAVRVDAGLSTDAADGDPPTSNPVPVGVVYRTSVTTYNAGDVGYAQGDVNGNTKVVGTGTAGTAAGGILTVQGVASMTPLLVSDGTGALNVIVDSGAVTVTNATATNLKAEAVGSLASNGVAAATNRVGTVPAVAQTSYLAGTAATVGRDMALQVGTDGLLWTANLPAIRPASFTASKNFAASSTTDNACLPGNASNTVLVTEVRVGGVQTTAGIVNLELAKRSTAGSGGTSANITVVPDDSNYSAGASVPVSYTGTGPTVGTLVGDIDNAYTAFLAAATASAADVYVGNFRQKPIVLRGTGEKLCVNLGGALTGGNLSVTYKWIETATITP